MQTITQPEPNSQIRNSILLECRSGVDLAQKLRASRRVQAQDTDRRQAADARHIVGLLRRLHFHRAHCPACLLREALSGSVLQ
jgi:hypothetical protein